VEIKYLKSYILKSLYWLGLRRQELIDLDIRDIDFERKWVTVREGKGGKTRIVPVINDELLSDLKHLTSGRKSGPVFMSNQGKGLSLRIVNHITQKTGQKAGITNPTPRLKHMNYPTASCGVSKRKKLY